MVSGSLVVGLRRARVSRLTRYLLSAVYQTCQLLAFCKYDPEVEVQLSALRSVIPSSFCTLTSFQNLFLIAVPGFIWVARISCPRLSNSAWRRRRSTRSPYWDAAGCGAAGGGPVAVMGRGLAFREVVVWRHWTSAGTWGFDTVLCDIRSSGEGCSGTIRCIVVFFCSMLNTKYFCLPLAARWGPSESHKNCTEYFTYQLAKRYEYDHIHSRDLSVHFTFDLPAEAFVTTSSLCQKE